ncbi:hypothetical protein E05_06390 [Plautia stali symbiont]|nr:hypothetical protein E05_06390 [Plautia stali symbiont]
MVPTIEINFALRNGIFVIYDQKKHSQIHYVLTVIKTIKINELTQSTALHRCFNDFNQGKNPARSQAGDN